MKRECIISNLCKICPRDCLNWRHVNIWYCVQNEVGQMCSVVYILSASFMSTAHTSIKDFVDSTIKQGIQNKNKGWKCSYYTNERLILYFSLHLCCILIIVFLQRYQWSISGWLVYGVQRHFQQCDWLIIS